MQDAGRMDGKMTRGRMNAEWLLDIGVDNQLSARSDVGMRTLHRHQGKLGVWKSGSLEV